MENEQRESNTILSEEEREPQKEVEVSEKVNEEMTRSLTFNKTSLIVIKKSAQSGISTYGDTQLNQKASSYSGVKATRRDSESIKEDTIPVFELKKPDNISTSKVKVTDSMGQYKSSSRISLDKNRKPTKSLVESKTILLSKDRVTESGDASTTRTNVTMATDTEIPPFRGSKLSLKKQRSVMTVGSRGTLEINRRCSIVGTPDAESTQFDLEKSGVLVTRISSGADYYRLKRDSSLAASSRRLNESLRFAEGSLMGYKKRSQERRSRIAFTTASNFSFRFANGQETDKHKITKFMNTYRLEAKNSFQPDRVKQVIRTVLDKELEGVRYEPKHCATLCLSLSSELRTTVKLLGFDRYKLICPVEIGENCSQGLRKVVKFLWDKERDNYAYYVYQNAHIYAVASVYGVYYE